MNVAPFVFLLGKFAIAFVATLLAACAVESGSTPTLLDSRPAVKISDPEVERIRALQAVKGRLLRDGCFQDVLYVQDEAECLEQCPSGVNCVYGCPNADQTASECRKAQWVEFADDLFDPEDGNESETVLDYYCDTLIPGLYCFTGDSSLERCAEEACEAARLLCEANSALELGAVRTRPVTLKVDHGTGVGSQNNNSTTFEFPPLTTAENAAMAELARERAKAAAYQAIETLKGAAGLLPTSSCSNGGIDDTIEALEFQSAGQVLTQTLKEAYDVFHEASARAVELNVAYADKQRSNPNLAVGVQRQVSGEVMSRSHAARLLVGGEPELDESIPFNGLCTVRELSGGAREALQLFRLAGMCPDDIMATPGSSTAEVAIENLIAGTGTGAGYPESGSLLQRFMQQRGVGSNYDFFSAHGVTTEHFEEAREYLTQEIRAFGRDRNAVVPAEKTQSPPPVDVPPYPIFAATRNAPAEPDPMYYASLARHSGGAPWISSSAPYPYVTSADLSNAVGVVDFSDVVLGLASQVLSADIATDNVTEAAMDSNLRYLIQAGRSEVQGRFRLCRNLDGDLFAEVLGFGSNDGLLLVRGEAGLDCAVNGRVDGAPCELSQTGATPPLVATELSVPWDVSSAAADFSVAATGSTLISNHEEGERFYLVKPKATAAAAGPGDFEAVAAGFGPPSANSCSVDPVAPELLRQAGRLLTPSTDWCSHPFLECDGTRFDERLPLEDELSDDGDGTESSWRHYLSLAKQAAAESDVLAQEYVQAGLDIDQRQESLEWREFAREDAAVHELERLQQTCGVNLNPEEVIKLLGTGDNATDFQSLQVTPINCPSCPCDGEGNQCPSSTVCIGGECLGGPVAVIAAAAEDDPEMGRLARCLGLDDSVYAAVTLGNKNLCYWRDPEDPNTICQSEGCSPDELLLDGSCPVMQDCPITVGPDGTCPMIEGPAEEPIEITAAALGYFAPEETIPTVGAGGLAQACDILRDSRENLGSNYVAALEGIPGAQSLLNPTSVQEYATRIGFGEEPGNHGTLMLGRTPWKSTGSLSSMPSTTWPCADEYLCSGSNPESMFCSVANCDDVSSRASEGSPQILEKNS